MELNEKEVLHQEITAILKKIQTLTNAYEFLLDRLLALDSIEERRFLPRRAPSIEKKWKTSSMCTQKIARKAAMTITHWR